MLPCDVLKTNRGAEVAIESEDRSYSYEVLDDLANRHAYCLLAQGLRAGDGFGYPSLHPFWILCELEHALQRATAIVMVGTSNPSVFRSLGLTPATDFDRAWATALKYVGPNFTTVVAPTFWSTPRIKFEAK